MLRALHATAIAERLRRVLLDISLNLTAVVLANGAYNTSKLADINRIVAALRADVAYNTWMLAKIMEIVADLPDAHQHIGQQVCVCLYMSVHTHARIYFLLMSGGKIGAELQ